MLKQKKKDKKNSKYLKAGPKWNIMRLLHSLKHLQERKTPIIVWEIKGN